MILSGQHGMQTIFWIELEFAKAKSNVEQGVTHESFLFSSSLSSLLKFLAYYSVNGADPLSFIPIFNSRIMNAIKFNCHLLFLLKSCALL